MKKISILIWFVAGIAGSVVGNKIFSTFIVSEYVNSTVEDSENEVAALLSYSSAAHYKLPIVIQESAAFCGVASLVNVMASYGTDTPSQKDILRSDLSPLDYWDVFFTGITLDELSELIASQGDYKTRVVRPTSVSEMATVLEQLGDTNTRIIANFSRMPLFGENIGHHTPVGAYDKQSGNILLFDVTAGYGNYLVKKEAMFVALQTFDSETDRQRGLLVVTKN